MVTAVELARRLGVDPKRLRSWLRRETAEGDLLAEHALHARWKFTEEEAAELAVAFESSRSAIRTPATSRPPSPHPRSEPSAPKAEDERPGEGHRVAARWNGQEIETLADLLRPGLRAVCVGINPSPISVAAGHYYQGRIGRRFWQRLQRAGVIEAAGTGREDDAAFLASIGFTDIVKRPTPRADAIPAAEFEHGRGLLAEKLRRSRPSLLIFTYKKAATALLGPFEGHGHRPELEFAGARVFVMPGPYERTDRVAAALKQLRGLLAD